MNWKKGSAALCLAALCLAGCESAEPEEPVSYETENTVLTVTLDGAEYEGSYTGSMLGELPQGEGSFTGGGLEFTGRFEEGNPDSGTLGAMPMKVVLDGVSYSGEYRGQLSGAAVSGEGSFSGLSALGLPLELEGLWEEGRPTEVTAEDALLTVQWMGKKRSGSYSGPLREGLPQGEGRFSSGDEGGPFVYEGGFDRGLFHGEGVLRYESPNAYTRTGTFTEGEFTPDYLQALDTLGTVEPLFTPTPAQREYIQQFPGLWSGENDRRNFIGSEYVEWFQRDYYQQLYFDHPEDYETAWLRLSSLRLLDVRRVEFGNGLVIHRLTLANDGYTLTYVCYLTGELPEETYLREKIDMYAMPLALSEYTNVMGQKIPCAVLLVGDAYIR